MERKNSQRKQKQKNSVTVKAQWFGLCTDEKLMEVFWGTGGLQNSGVSNDSQGPKTYHAVVKVSFNFTE